MSDSNSKNKGGLELRACNSQPSEPFTYWGLKIYKSTFNDISLQKQMQPQNKGPGMSWGQSYVMPMTSCDIIGVIGGWVVSQGWGVSCKVDQFGNLNNPSHFN